MARKPAVLREIGDGETDIWLLAPRDRALAFVGKHRRGWLQSVLVADESRVEPTCSHYGVCGGCSRQHLGYRAALELKAGQAYAGLPCPDPLPPVPSPSAWFYRTKVEFSFGSRGQLGFMRKGRWDQVTPVETCWIGPAANPRLLAATRAWAGRHGLPGWDARTQEGLLRYLVLRQSSTTGAWLAVLVAQGEVPQAAEWARELTELGAAGVMLAVQSATAGAVKPDRVDLLAGQDRLTENLGNLRFELGWRSFYQSNPPAYLRLLETARSWVGPVDHLLDLYCGIGTIGLFLQAERLTGVESVPEAIENARQNAVLNGRVGDFHVCASEDWPDLSCDLLVLDPPRSGCHPRLIKRLAAGEGPDRILYVSCNPKRLQEEMLMLWGLYRIEKLQCFDFFPQTPHIEALCLLTKT